jgi:hypothetical protein
MVSCGQKESIVVVNRISYLHFSDLRVHRRNGIRESRQGQYHFRSGSIGLY